MSAALDARDADVAAPADDAATATPAADPTATVAATSVDRMIVRRRRPRGGFGAVCCSAFPAPAGVSSTVSMVLVLSAVCGGQHTGRE
jgi:hypothetical protein